MASTVNFWVSPHVALNSEFKPRCGVKVRSSSSGDSTVLLSDSVVVNGASVVGEKERTGLKSIGGGNGRVGTKVEEKKRVKDVVFEELEVLYDDGFGTESVKDYLDVAKEMIKPDGGPPRWFCPVECGRPLKDSPTLLFLPGLVKFVEETVRLEHASSPNKPIYLVGDSFGGCLALAVAARNPMIDLVVILANPATSFGRSQLQPFFPILEALPDEPHFSVPYLLSFVMGDPVKMAMINVDSWRPPAPVLQELLGNLTALLPRLSGLADIIPKDTLLWKLKLLTSAAAYANSRLHAVKAEVLVLASGKDNMLPSEDEAQRLSSSLRNCRVRHFKNNGHTLLLEDGINLMTVIKGTFIYRRSSGKHDFVSDFLPPSMSEYKYAFDQVMGLFRFAASPVMFSTLEDGKIVKGLAGGSK
ncbi:hypothetical protein L1049_020584 [Liquidambar formosana]|uniref:AB hydrolase-1 domain-containing protein n=1 Tax=Liquidambar formosana TaxID=63359 RepID=A0AAP0SE66_LIQFO